MTRFYYFCGHEQFHPETLVRHAQLAEEAGFDGLVVSEHFHPWVDDHSASGFAYATLAAMAVATERVSLVTGVTTPLFRFHPAVVAQAAATIDRLSGGRFDLGVGTGENLNEGPLGYPFPKYAERAARMGEALEIMRRLLDGGASIDGRQSIGGIGIERLERVCVEHIAALFLQQTRFDPLHDAASEQALYDRLGGWLRSLQRSGSIVATLERGGEEYEVRVKRGDLAAVLQSSVEPLMQQLRSRLTSGRTVAVQVSDRLAGFPGIIDAFDGMTGVATFVLGPAAAPRGALSRAGQFAGGNGGVTFKTSLQWDQAAAGIAVSDRVERTVQSGDVPTHVLYAGRVFRLGPEPLTIGCEIANGEYGIRLPAGHEGVSRRHCSIRVGQNGTELIDHSRFGTRLNGHVIDKSAVLRAGDTIGIGEPSVDLVIVTESTPEHTGDDA